MQAWKPKQLFFIKAALFVVLIILIDQLAGMVLYHFFTRQNSGEFAVANHVAYNMNEDILILGSSRASHHYNPSLIKKDFMLSCYNGGRDGEGILYNLAMLQLALQHHIPKYVILDLESSSLAQNSDGKDKLSILLPYLKQSDKLKEIVKEKSPFELYKALFQTYRYNGQVLSILQHNFLHSISSQYSMGFRPLDNKGGRKNLSKKNLTKPYSDQLDKDYINALFSIISVCKEKNIKLFVFISPRYNDDTQLNSFIKIKDICKSHNIPFHDFTNNLFFKRPEYYYDKAHLNGTGANIYTDTVIAFMKKTMPMNDANLADSQISVSTSLQ